MRESRAQWERLVHHVEEPLLLGGWNFPEHSGGLVWRWTSLRSQVAVPAGYDVLRIEGMSHGARQVRLEAGGACVEQQVSGAFALDLALDGERRIAVLEVDAEMLAPEDPRELGVTVGRVALRRGGTWHEVDLHTDAEQVLRRTNVAAWIDALVTTAESRDAALDALFVEVRGPHSAPMRAWLDQHVHEYDLVLVQGTPFAPIAWVPPIARAGGVPVALLPHFHVEDRYYHWKSYYEQFRDADCVLAAPRSTKAPFFDAIDAPAEVVPGGGIELAEFTPERIAQARAQFRRVHPGERPFVLVLGRKAGGKRYNLVLQAAQLPGAGFDVVMVGPDDDGIPITAPNVHYYGARPRDFVAGALAECVCLANMSESESFGIVLLESWAAGRPVVAQRRCLAFADLVEDGVNGFLVETPAQIAERVRRYIADPALASAHAAEGMRHVRLHGWDALGARIYDVAIRKLVRGERVGPQVSAGRHLDPAPFLEGASQATLGQVAAREVHDEDFKAFARLPGLRVDCILDIGGNRGQSVASLNAVFPRAHIHCFEANSMFFPVLDEVARALEGRCVVHRYGLGRSAGTFSFYVPWAGGQPWLEESSTKLEYYENPWVAKKFEERGGLELQELTAEIRVGDELALEPQLVKIDVEGAENDVILGLSATIRRARPILLVENSDWPRVTQTLAQLGYRPYRFDTASGLVPFFGETTNTFYLHDEAHRDLVPGERVAADGVAP
jgi:FkbM family methyltransferase